MINCHSINNSSMLTEIEYDNEKELLRIKFAKGGWYEYSEVPKVIYEGLLNATSAGKYFLANIKDKFSTEKF